LGQHRALLHSSKVNQRGVGCSHIFDVAILIGIGRNLTVPLLPHHRAYGSCTTAVNCQCGGLWDSNITRWWENQHPFRRDTPSRFEGHYGWGGM